MNKLVVTIAIAGLLASCSGNKDGHDATGTFEAVETIVPAEASGIIESLRIEEGQVIAAGQQVGQIDTLQLSLKKQQLLAQIKAVESRRPGIEPQLAVYREEMKQAIADQKRMQNLYRADAATAKQAEDAASRVAVLKKQIAAIESELRTSTSGLNEDAEALRQQVKQIDDQLAKSKIVSKAAGTVLVKYAETGEMAVTGKPLFKIADLTDITLRVYITGSQLALVKLNDTVKVYVDAAEGEYKEYPGTIQWISSKAEFTPKTIQTKDERANLVYAVKVKVKNDGYLKIGMYGEIQF